MANINHYTRGKAAKEIAMVLQYAKKNIALTGATQVYSIEGTYLTVEIVDCFTIKVHGDDSPKAAELSKYLTSTVKLLVGAKFDTQLEPIATTSNAIN